MTRVPAPRRLLRRSALLAGVLALCAAGTAHADISGVVTTPGGIPIPGVDITVNEPDGGFATSADTNANGAYVIPSASLAGDTPPFTINAAYTDRCKDFEVAQLKAASGAVADGATGVNLVLDAFPFCATSFVPSTSPQPTGNAWPERGQILSGPGGLTYLRTFAPFDATGLTLTLNTGAVVGASEDESQVPLTAPPTPYNGPVNLTFTSDGVATTRTIGTLISGPITKPNPPRGVSDLAAIVDVSGSMGGNDPTNRRLDATRLLIDLAGQGDRIVGTGFDDDFREIFPLTTIAGEATKRALKGAAKKNIGDFGGTNYNVAFASAFNSLASQPFDPAVPKSAVFLTDGANGGTYDNSHLRFAYNGTGTTWPVCVVQLGRGFQKEDTARLKRIAAETGGTYAAAPTNARLQDLFFTCRGRSSGTTTLLKKSDKFKVGQLRVYSRKIKKGQRLGTFFVSWGEGKYRVQIVQPGGRVFRGTAGKNVRFVLSKSSALFQVKKPKTGLWKVRVTRLKTGARQDLATTTVTVKR